MDNSTTIVRIAAGERDVEVIPAGPGALRLHDSPVIAADWDAGDASLLVSDIADHERQSIAELTIAASPHTSGGTAVDVSVELTPGDIDDLIAVLSDIRRRHRHTLPPALSEYPTDHYFSIEAEEHGEGHILCLPSVGEALEASMRHLLPEADISVEAGGEYGWIIEPGDDIDAMAREIIEHEGFILD